MGGDPWVQGELLDLQSGKRCDFIEDKNLIQPR